MSRPRALAYFWVTLGLLLTYTPLLPTSNRLVLGSGLILKTAGVVLDAPGLMTVSGTLGFLVACSLPGRLAAWLVTLLLLEPLLRWIERPRNQQPSLEPAEAERRLTRRTFLVTGSGLAAGALLSGYGFCVERRNLQLEQFLLSLPDLPPELEGLRLVVMADWHCGPINRPGDLHPAVVLANRCRPDLVLMPGDFVSGSGHFGEAAQLASQLRPRVPGGVMLGWGNHDHWNDLDVGNQEMSRAGCQILTNRAVFLNHRRELDSSGKSGLWLGGLDDLWAGSPDLIKTLSPLPRQQPRLVLSHNPDLAEERFGARLDLLLSGHTHGGQVRLPGLGSPVLPSRYGQKYTSGFVQGPNYPVYVTRGVGVGGIPIRLGVPPEVTLFELRRGPATAIQPTRLV